MPIYTESLSLLVPENSEWADLSKITWEEAALLPLCLLDQSMHERRIVDEVFAKIGCAPQVSVTASDSILNLIFHVMFAGLVTIVPSHFTRLPGSLPGTKAIELTAPNLSREVGLIWSTNEPMMPMAKMMISIARELQASGEMERRLGESRA